MAVRYLGYHRSGQPESLSGVVLGGSESGSETGAEIAVSAVSDASCVSPKGYVVVKIGPMMSTKV